MLLRAFAFRNACKNIHEMSVSFYTVEKHAFNLCNIQKFLKQEVLQSCAAIRVKWNVTNTLTAQANSERHSDILIFGNAYEGSGYFKFIIVFLWGTDCIKYDLFYAKSFFISDTSSLNNFRILKETTLENTFYFLQLFSINLVTFMIYKQINDTNYFQYGKL